MEFKEYAERAARTAMYPQSNRFEYLALGLNGEAGEVAEIIKKIIRDNTPFDEELRHKLVRELGDCLWYLANFARELGVTLEEIAEANLEKLKDRKSRDVITGSGDYR